MKNKPYTPDDVLECASNILNDYLANVPSEVSVVYGIRRWGSECFAEALGILFQFIDSADKLGVFKKI